MVLLGEYRQRNTHRQPSPQQLCGGAAIDGEHNIGVLEVCGRGGDA
jgi:hypothetical protein